MPKLKSFDNHQTIFDMMFLLEYEIYNYRASRKAGYKFEDLDVERTGIMLLINTIKKMEMEESKNWK